jgi:thiamine-phosphate pyrophosphorylase
LFQGLPPRGIRKHLKASDSVAFSPHCNLIACDSCKLKWKWHVLEAPHQCQLYVVVEAGEGAAERLAAAIDATEVATVLVGGIEGRPLEVGVAKPLVEQARRAGIAALVADDAALARACGADGVHLGANKDTLGAYRIARAVLGDHAIIGVAPGVSRHDAMTLAEAGADYIAFGAPAHLKDAEKGRARRDELIAWWGEIFQVPCVAFDVTTAAEAETLAHDRADFVAVTLAAGLPPADAGILAGAVAAAIRAREAAA